MRSVSGRIDYSIQLNPIVGDRSSFDQSAPYSVSCNYYGAATGDDGLSHKCCVIESSGNYALSADETKVLLAKNVKVIMNDCYVDVFSTTSNNDITVDISLYVGTTTDAVDSSTVYLYRYMSHVPKTQQVRFNIPNISYFDVPSGKNVILSVTTSGAAYVNGHFISCVDD